jgi:cellulose synthase/poly-beta-1,6-N-acetylglucosamine synthase-like glycosyltransferase
MISTSILPTVTIGIPAHNEERSISKLLDCLAIQKQDKCVIERIIVACDGCTDNTAGIVQEYSKKLSILSVINDGRRLGQGGRLTEFYKLNESDIFITFDADTTLGHDHVVDEIVACFDSPKVGLVGGYDLPYKAESFFESLVVTGVEIWQRTRESINGGDSVHNHHGCVSAVSKELGKQVEYVKSVTSNDEFIYHKAKQLGYSFKYCKTAPVYYRCPNTLQDFLKQNARFIGCWDQLVSYFGDSIKSEYFVPNSLKVLAVVEVLAKKPVLAVLTIILLVISRYTVVFYKNDFKGGFWSSATTTKR